MRNKNYTSDIIIILLCDVYEHPLARRKLTISQLRLLRQSASEIETTLHPEQKKKEESEKRASPLGKKKLHVLITPRTATLSCSMSARARAYTHTCGHKFLSANSMH